MKLILKIIEEAVMFVIKFAWILLWAILALLLLLTFINLMGNCGRIGFYNC